MKFRILGLNEYEEKSYLTLVELGAAKAHKIAIKSGVPYGRIYDVLESLVKKGFAKIIIQKPKTYIAVEPKLAVENEIDKKIEELKKMKEEVKTLGKKYERFPEEAIFIVKGKENFNRLIGVEKGEEFGFSIKYSFEPHPVWMRNIKSSIEKGIDVKTIGTLNEKTKENIKKWLTIEKQIKKFPNEGVAFSITEKHVIIALIKADMTLVIKDEAFIKMMKSLFEAAWQVSKEIKKEDLE